MKAKTTIRRAIRKLRKRIDEAPDRDARGVDYAYVAECALLWALEDETRYDIAKDIEHTATVHDESARKRHG